MAIKFKEGDRIVLRPKEHDLPRGALTVGECYTVGGVHVSSNPRYVGILRADHGREDQWYTSEFELAGGPW